MQVTSGFDADTSRPSTQYIIISSVCLKGSSSYCEIVFLGGWHYPGTPRVVLPLRI
jgi:hypothetical protein